MQQNDTNVNTPDVAQAMRNLVSSGVSVIPIRAGTKQPSVTEWKSYQSQIVDDSTLNQWLQDEPEAFAVIGGSVSGNVEIIDFDDNSDVAPTPYTAKQFFDLWMAEVSTLIEGFDIPIQITGGNGYQAIYRSIEVSKNAQLAWIPDENPQNKNGRKIAIETRGEGGYALMAPSVHPSGNNYRMYRGSISRIPTIPAAVRSVLLEAAQKLCLAPLSLLQIEEARRKTEQSAQTKKRPAMNNGESVIDAFNARVSIETALVRTGHTQKGRRFYHPGADKTVDAGVVIIDNTKSYHWDTNDGLCDSHSHDAFDVVAHYEHNGDYRAAVKAIAAELGIESTAKATSSTSERKVDLETGEISDPITVAGEFFDSSTGEQKADDAMSAIRLLELASLDNINAAPDLPEYAQLSAEESRKASTTGRWLRRYVEFASEASSMTPPIFHLSVGLSLMSAAVGRRMHLKVGVQKIYPNLYTLYCGPSTLERKTTGLQVAMGLLDACGMRSPFTFAERQTPEAFISDTTTALPNAYEKMSERAKQLWLEQRPLSAQRAWFMDEASHLLDSFTRDYTSGLLPLVLDLYDSKDHTTGRNTKNYGLEFVENAYLTVFGATTHGAIAKHMQKPEHWQNGLFARFAIVTSDQDVEWEFWKEGMEYPADLVNGLKGMAFGVLGPLPKVTMETESIDGTDDSAKVSNGGLVVRVEGLTDTGCIINRDAWDAWERYSKTVSYDMLRDLRTRDKIGDELAPNYGRFSTMLIKVAMLLALDDADVTPVVIEDRHIFAAQEIVEMWRESLHRARGKGRKTEFRSKADNIKAVLVGASGKLVAKRELLRALNSTWKDIEESIENLIEEGSIEVEEIANKRGPKTIAYRLVIGA